MNCLSGAIFLALCATVLCTKPSLQDLQEALSTNDKIWIGLRNFYSAAGTDVLCVYDKVTTRSGTSYTLEHGYRKEEKTFTGTLTATAMKEGDEAVLNVKIPEEGQDNKHVLKYWNSEQKNCFILELHNKTSNFKQCQLHIWDNALTDYNPQRFPCEDKYDEYCGTTKHAVYSSTCRTAQ
uniref:Putative lipocalin-2 1 n=1 Tax=Amblyomma triste TaxID=251400 RepID=A0A023GA49_AMBTT